MMASTVYLQLLHTRKGTPDQWITDALEVSRKLGVGVWIGILQDEDLIEVAIVPESTLESVKARYKIKDPEDLPGGEIMTENDSETAPNEAQSHQQSAKTPRRHKDAKKAQRRR